MPKDYFTVAECAKFMARSEDYVRSHIHNCPDFPWRRVGIQYVIPKEKLFRWMKNNGLGGVLDANYV